MPYDVLADVEADPQTDHETLKWHELPASVILIGAVSQNYVVGDLLPRVPEVATSYGRVADAMYEQTDNTHIVGGLVIADVDLPAAGTRRVAIAFGVGERDGDVAHAELADPTTPIATQAAIVGLLKMLSGYEPDTTPRQDECNYPDAPRPLLELVCGEYLCKAPAGVPRPSDGEVRVTRTRTVA